MTPQQRTGSSSQPPQAWVEENFVHDGKVKFCQSCRMIPAVPMGKGHDCDHLGLEAHILGLLGEWAEEPAEVDRITLWPNADHRGGWYAYYESEPTPQPASVEYKPEDFG